MAVTNFTSKITDISLINKLPDMSFMDYLFLDSATKEDVKAFLDSFTLRKKLQSIFEYKLDEDTKAKLAEFLRKDFKQKVLEDDPDAKIVEQPDGTLLVNDDVFYFNINNPGDGVFAQPHFRELFFSDEVIEKLVSLDDPNFKKALYAVPSFWDGLLSIESALNKFKSLVGDDAFLNIVHNSEPGTAKYYTMLVGEDFNKVDSISDLVSNPVIFSKIIDNYKDQIAKSYYYDLAMFMVLTNTSSLEDAVNHLKYEDIVNNDSLKEVVTNINVLKRIKNIDKEKYKSIIDTDQLLGAIIGKKLNIPNINFSQLIYDDSAINYLQMAFNDKELIEIISESSLLDIYYKDLVRKMSAILKIKNKIVSYADDKNVFVAYFDAELAKLVIGTIKSDNQNKALALVKVNEIDPITKNIKMPFSVIFASGKENPSLAVYSINKNIFTSDLDTTLLFSAIKDKSINYVNVIGNHIFAQDIEGNIFDNKFIVDTVTQDFTYSMNINDLVLFCKDTGAGFIKGSDFSGLDIDGIINYMASNKEKIKDVFGYKGKIYIINNEGAVKEVHPDAFVDTDILNDFQLKDNDGNVVESLTSNKIKKVLVVDGMLYVIDELNKLWYSDGAQIRTINDIVDVAVGNNLVNCYNSNNELVKVIIKSNDIVLTGDPVFVVSDTK